MSSIQKKSFNETHQDTGTYDESFFLEEPIENCFYISKRGNSKWKTGSMYEQLENFSFNVATLLHENSCPNQIDVSFATWVYP